MQVKTKVQMLKNTSDYSLMPRFRLPPKIIQQEMYLPRVQRRNELNCHQGANSQRKIVTKMPSLVIQRENRYLQVANRPKVGSEELAPSGKLSMGYNQKLDINNGSGSIK
ncbi:uncharacterized protein LOC111408201 [Olea europaea var. sylvestris]|uniref:uncharacterized protein LOC111408201 n=1 Tax=Olea europaea var. sylvestris TaxID=158386 RepID=UPI000C1D556B|nr:uncharacterized protein LOC111408201 [Olea europaea var. sylvestris]